MSFYTDWFIADEAEAETLAASESPFEDWPNLSLKSIGEIDLMNLWALLRGGNEGAPDTVSEALLFEDSNKILFVVRMTSDFVDALCTISEANQRDIAIAWSQSEELADMQLPLVIEALSQLSAFAKQSRHVNKPILSMFA